MVDPNEHLKTLESPSSKTRANLVGDEGPCLSEDEILAFARGALHGGAFDRAHAHIDLCVRCQQAVTEAIHALDSNAEADLDTSSWNSVFRPNTLIGKRYRVLRLLGRGGMGEVYEAFDTELHERLALKTVTATACDSSRAVRSLKAEVQLARRIAHANVCKIYDFRTHNVESTGAAVHYLVMEFVEGEGLGKRLRERGPLPVAEANAIARELLLGLRAAHQAGIVHRDFKSDNVMLRTDAQGVVHPVILDFGLAKALNASGHAATTLTHDQGMVGTLGYMAPEQIEGTPLTPATDLYAFGVVWFEMLTASLPFTGDSPAASAIARLHVAPAPPSLLVREIPEWVDEIVLRCLGRHRQDRYSQADEVLDALDRGQLGLAAARRSRRWLTFVAPGVIGAGVLLGWWGVGVHSQVPQARPATPVPSHAAPIEGESAPRNLVSMASAASPERAVPPSPPTTTEKAPGGAPPRRGEPPRKLAEPMLLSPDDDVPPPKSSIATGAAAKREPEWLEP